MGKIGEVYWGKIEANTGYIFCFKWKADLFAKKAKRRGFQVERHEHKSVPSGFLGYYSSQGGRYEVLVKQEQK